MSITPAEFKIRFPTFASTEEPRIQIYIDEAELEMGSRWGDFFDVGQGYYVAHMLTLDPNEAESIEVDETGPLTSKAVGDVKHTYGSSSTSSDSSQEGFWAKTNFGSNYWRLRKLIGTRVIAVSELWE